jgi:DNA-binding PadR family transcriptional regulator
MKLESSNQALTEMEGAVIATIAERGPLTAYAVKEVFRASPSSFWSGSAGAVYPLVKRLEERGFLRSQEASESRRPKRVFLLTVRGQKALAAWLTDVRQAVSLGYDPLRTRAQFSHLLDSDERARFFDEVEACIMDGRAPDSSMDHVGRLHGLWIRARASWFKAFRGDLGEN